MVRYKGFAKDFDKTPKAWQYFAIIASFVIMIVMVGLMLSTVFGQITDSEFINCIIMETKGTQVVLGTDSDCSTELFTQAVTYYKSIGYNETSYSNVLGEQTITLTYENPLLSKTPEEWKQTFKEEDEANKVANRTQADCQELKDFGLKDKYLKDYNCEDYKLK
jgi:hypothetical protein